MVDENTQAIVAMAWARAYGLDDDAFSGAEGAQRRTLIADGDEIVAIELLGRTVLVGAPWALDEAVEYTDEALLSVPGLLDLAKGHSPRGTSVEALLYADDYLSAPGLSEAEVTADPEAVAELLPRCAPDDVRGLALTEHEHLFVLLDEGERPTAAAAYSTQHGILADLSFVGAIDTRGTGAVEIAAAVAMHDALDAGLIPQLRLGIDDDHVAALALGFARLGVISRVTVEQ
ncbi:hypothetical protein [Cumulibacter soli]|uniref:hypothetical protein n=1 Tax=Cumulibacter soli TaxID=2546344 RepID=UPI00106894CC|nr:hypothetical protein [Cumulibacter soli]